MLGKILDKASLIKAKLVKDELDQALIQATNDDNWQASTAILHQISSSAYNHQKWQKINDFIWQRLRNSKRWKKVLKALHIVEFLLKNGPSFAVDQLRKDLIFFKSMESFQAFEDGVDRGASIRQKGRVVALLLQNQDMLEDERVLAKQIRERMSHLSGNINFSSQSNPKIKETVNKYQSYNSNTYAKNEQNKGFYNYGSGNYGDRQENKHHKEDYFQQASRKAQTPIANIQKKEQTKQEPKQRKIEPIVYLNLKKKKVQQKPNYQSLAQRLSKPAIEKSSPIVPDLSYKNKNTEDLLIDTESYFIESRYHFQPTQQHKQAQENKSNSSQANQPQQPFPIFEPNQIATKQYPVVSSSTPSLLTQFESFLFLGVESPPQVNPVNSNINKSQYPIQQEVQSRFQPSIPATQATLISYSQPALVTLPPNNPVSGTGYSNSFTNYQQYSYSPFNTPNRFTNFPSQYGYMQQQAYQPIYQTQVSPNSFYQPISTVSAAPSSFPTASQQTKSTTASQVADKKEDDFGDFKNGGSFDIEKINWMSKKEKNLTDLADITYTAKDIVKTEKKKQFSNNIKIDPWAW